MRKYLYGIMAMIFGAVAFIACEDEIDEVAQWNKVVDNSVEIAHLKDVCEVINSNVVSLNALAEAQKDNIGITDVKDVEEGCVIFFANGKYVVLRNGKDGVDGKDGKDGVDGKDGKDGYVPAIAIKKDADGIYYWTCDGAFMLDETGNKVPAQGKDGENGTNGTNGLVAQFMISATGELQYRYNDTDAWTSLGNVKGADGADGINGTNGTNGTNGADGKTPTFKIVEGNLLVSYDGENWNNLGNVKGADGVNGADGTNGTNGKNGKDGITPEFMIQDGKWFVSYNNKYSWVELGQATGDKGEKGDTGAKGDKGAAGVNGTNGVDGITPKLKIENGYWYISYDGGKTYETEPLGKATGDKGANGVDGKTPTFKLEGGVLKVSTDGGKTWSSLGSVTGSAPLMKYEDGKWYVSYDGGKTWNTMKGTSINLSKTSVSIYTDGSFELTATEDDGTIIDPSKITWTVSSESVLTHTTSGNVTSFVSVSATAASITITATYNGFEATCKVTIIKIDNSYPVSGTIDGHAYVDLGLPSGLKWATMNVGASKNNDYGTYFAWGEIAPAPDNNYCEANCKLYDKETSSLQKSGVLDSKSHLVADYDAATQNWSENWRMPSVGEFGELLDNCTWTWTTLGGVKGYKVASKKAGNTNWIFLPAAGDRFQTSSYDVGSLGYYWCCNTLVYEFTHAYGLKISSGYKGVDNPRYRYFGHPVRPVVKE